MRRPRVAVDAAVLAAAVGIEGPIEWDIGGLGDLVDDALGAIEEDVALDAIGGAVLVLAFDPLAIDLFAEDVEADGLETVAGINACAAAVGHTVWERIAIGEAVFRHTEHHANFHRLTSTLFLNELFVEKKLNGGWEWGANRDYSLKIC